MPKIRAGQLQAGMELRIDGRRWHVCEVYVEGRVVQVAADRDYYGDRELTRKTYNVRHVVQITPKKPQKPKPIAAPKPKIRRGGKNRRKKG